MSCTIDTIKKEVISKLTTSEKDSSKLVKNRNEKIAKLLEKSNLAEIIEENIGDRLQLSNTIENAKVLLKTIESSTPQVAPEDKVTVETNKEYDSQLTINSGGANGGDSVIGKQVAKRNGAENHYYIGTKTPRGNINLASNSVFRSYAESYLPTVVKSLYGEDASSNLIKNISKNLLMQRNMAQVLNSGSVVAIAPIRNAGFKETNKEGKEYPDGTKQINVSGGTRIAIEAAKLKKIPIYVYNISNKDYEEEGWYEWNYDDNKFDKLNDGESPKITSEFAGIGSRKATGKKYEDIISKMLDDNGFKVGATDSKYELFPGVIANSDQKNALDKITKFIGNDSDTEYVLKGRGGTGKTTIINKALELAGAIPEQIFFTTISYKALAVIRKTNQPTKYADSQYYVLESALFDQNMGKGEIKSRFTNSTPKIIVVDESSMLDTATINKITSQAKLIGAKVLYMGDNVQLPPVDAKGGKNMSSPIFDTEKHSNVVELFKRERQGEGSPILPITDILANYVENPNDNKIVFDGIDHKNSEGTVEYRNDKDSDSIIKEFAKDFEKDPESTRYVWLNKSKHDNTLSLVKRIRKELFGSKSSEKYIVGEQLVLNDNYRKEMPDWTAYNSEEFTFISSKNSKDYTINYKMYIDSRQIDKTFEYTGGITTITAKSNTDGRIVDIVEANDRSALEAQVNERVGYKQRNTVLQELGDVSYAYVISSHKAQGSTYKNVYTDVSNVLDARNPFGDIDRAKNLYTATSRASEKLVLINAENHIGKVSKSKTNPPIKVKGGSVKVIDNALNNTQMKDAIGKMDKDFKNSKIDKQSNVTDHARQSAVVYGPIDYKYFGSKTHKAKPMPEWLSKLARTTEAELGKDNGYYNQVLFNKFAEDEGIGSHMDGSPQALSSAIKSITVSSDESAYYPFVVNRDGTRDERKVDVTKHAGSVAIYSIGDTKSKHVFGGTEVSVKSGSLSEMSTGEIYHKVGKAGKGGRYSITFRHIPEGRLPISSTSSNNLEQVKIDSNQTGLEFALTNPTHVSPKGYKWNRGDTETKDRLEPLRFKGKMYPDVESVYQEKDKNGKYINKDTSESKTKPSKDNSKNYKLMVNLIRAKMIANPWLKTEINKAGGINYLNRIIHQPTSSNSVWETGGQDWFKSALIDAYKSNTSSASVVPNSNIVIQKEYYTRKDVKNNTNNTHLFGDNKLDATLGYNPKSTQAVIRGLKNSFGILTKKNRNTYKNSYYSDSDIKEYTEYIGRQIKRIKGMIKRGNTIVLPANGIGTGAAKLKEKAPLLYDELAKALNDLTGITYMEPLKHNSNNNNRNTSSSSNNSEAKEYEESLKELSDKVNKKVKFENINSKFAYGILLGHSVPLGIAYAPVKGITIVQRITQQNIQILKNHVGLISKQNDDGAKAGLNKNIKSVYQQYIDGINKANEYYFRSNITKSSEIKTKEYWENEIKKAKEAINKINEKEYEPGSNEVNKLISEFQINLVHTEEEIKSVEKAGGSTKWHELFHTISHNGLTDAESYNTIKEIYKQAMDYRDNLNDEDKESWSLTAQATGRYVGEHPYWTDSAEEFAAEMIGNPNLLAGLNVLDNQNEQGSVASRLVKAAVELIKSLLKVEIGTTGARLLDAVDKLTSGSKESDTGKTTKTNNNTVEQLIEDAKTITDTKQKVGKPWNIKDNQLWVQRISKAQEKYLKKFGQNTFKNFGNPFLTNGRKPSEDYEKVLGTAKEVSIMYYKWLKDGILPTKYNVVDIANLEQKRKWILDNLDKVRDADELWYWRVPDDKITHVDALVAIANEELIKPMDQSNGTTEAASIESILNSKLDSNSKEYKNIIKIMKKVDNCK